ncbi:MAG: YhbY family RNA-binding protein [Gemmatimonadaceae bacterium]
MTGKDRAALRAEAHHLKALVHIGHAGLTPALMQSLADILRTHELVKAQVAQAGELSAKDAANDIAAQMDAEVIQVIGRTFTLYRENPELKRGSAPPWR